MSDGARERAHDARSGSQTLQRGMDVLEAVASGCASPAEIAERLSLTRTTTYRLLKHLTDRRYLAVTGGRYGLGPQLLALSRCADETLDLTTVAGPVIDRLARETGEAVNLGVRTGRHVLYIYQAPGTRRLTVRHRVGDRNRLERTALGQALMLDGDEAVSDAGWTEQLRSARERGFGLHHDDGGDGIICVAAPIRDAGGAIVAALSVSSIPVYADAARLPVIADAVRAAATSVSMELGGVHALAPTKPRSRSAER